MDERKIRWWVVLPPSILVVLSVVFNIVMPEKFLNAANSVNNFILNNFGTIFSLIGVIVVILCIIVFLHPISKTKIGGEDAKPILNKYSWFAVSFCTSVAAGVLFWAIVEPIYHMTNPPGFLEALPNSSESAVFSMSTIFLHWTFTPYAIYTIPAIVFAVVYYNKKKSNSLSSIAQPLVGDKYANKFSPHMDALALYTLIPGMASSLATGVLTISGGFNYLTKYKSNNLTIFIIMFIIVSIFIISCSTGLTKGIKKLSSFNIIIFGILLVLVFIFTNKVNIFNVGLDGLVDYIGNFTKNSMTASLYKNDSWGNSWTVFYWCNWMAWAPITALFLGRIAYGYKIRQVIMVNFIIPAACAIVWLSIFSGTSISMQLESGILGQVLNSSGAESVIYAFFDTIPFAKMIIPLFILVLLVSLVTACDSTTSSMSNLCYDGIRSAGEEAGVKIKIFWGVLIGSLGFIMLSTSGIDGIKTLSNIGGLPGMIVQVIAILSIIKLMVNFKKDNLKVEERELEYEETKK